MITFNPALPSDKLSSISKLGAGVMDKLALEFDTVFWDEESDWLNYIDDGQLRWT